MPFYEYECLSCRYYLEILQKISEKPVKKCPSCGKAGFKRLMSAPVFRLKGSGWYETDFKSDKEGQRNLAGTEPQEAKAPEVKAPEAKAPEAKGGTEDKSAAKAETVSATGDKVKAERAAPADKSKRATKAPAAGARNTSAKRTLKRPVPRAAPRSARSAARGSRRR